MSQIYAREKFTAGEVIDADKISGTLADFANAIDGDLGEQNFKEGAFAADKVENDVALRIYYSEQEVNWTTLNADSEPTAAPTNATRVPMALTWASLWSATLNIRGSSVRVVVDLQMDAGATSNNANYWASLVGCAFAFRIDGTVYSETIQGGEERSNDPKGEAVGWDIASYCFEIAVALSPGVHTFEVVAKPSRSNEDVNAFDTTSYYEVFNHTFYIVEQI